MHKLTAKRLAELAEQADKLKAPEVLALIAEIQRGRAMNDFLLPALADLTCPDNHARCRGWTYGDRITALGCIKCWREAAEKAVREC